MRPVGEEGQTAASSEVGRVLWGSLTQGGGLWIAGDSHKLSCGFWSGLWCGGEKSGVLGSSRPSWLCVGFWHYPWEDEGCRGVSGEEGKAIRVVSGVGKMVGS